MPKPTSKQLETAALILGVSSAVSGLAMLWWIAASMQGLDALAIGAVLLAGFGYHTYRAVCTLNSELQTMDDRADLQNAN